MKKLSASKTLIDDLVAASRILAQHEVLDAYGHVSARSDKRPDRFMLVTDAMPSVGSNQTSFMLQGKRIEVRDGVCVDENGVLSGSALDMASAVRNCVELLGLPLEQAARMASTYPAEFLGLGGELGRIAPGYAANLVAVDDGINVVGTWIDGQGSDQVRHLQVV